MLLLFFFAATSYAQLQVPFSTDTLELTKFNGHWVPAVHLVCSNVGDFPIPITEIILPKELYFTGFGTMLPDTLHPHESLTVAISPTRTITHDTVFDCCVVAEDWQRVHYLQVPCKAGVVGVKERVCGAQAQGKAVWRTITGELADTSKTGIYFTHGNRKVVVR